jgi:hypothetical protein
MWGVTLTCLLIAATKFVKEKTTDDKETEVYYRLLSLFSKNKYGYRTRFMSDFDLFLEAMLNERFIDDSFQYYEDPVVMKEIEDQE